MASSKPTSDNPEINDEEDDYMTMTFTETSTKHESSLQRQKRQKREVCIPTTVQCFL
jgi:hypothetical protein